MIDVFATEIEAVKVIVPRVHEDSRGYFSESYQSKEFAEKVAAVNFVQDNEAKSVRGTLRGLHFQAPPFAQAKLVRVVRGSVIDVAVDLRNGSPTFGRHVAVELNEENRKQLFVPRGFAHGYLALEDHTVFQYKVDNFYDRASDRGVRYDDPEIGIDWNEYGLSLVLSEKDLNLPRLTGLDSGFNYL